MKADALPPASASPYLAAAIMLLVCAALSALWYKVPHPLVILVITLAPLGMIFVLRQAFFIVLLFVIFSFFRIHEVFPQLYSLKIPLLLSAAAIGNLLWHVGFSQKIKTYWRQELTIASVFFALVVIGVVMASNLPIAIAYFKGVYWKIMVMMYAIAWLTRTPKDFLLALVSITIAGSMVGIVAISNKLNGIGMVEETRVTIGRDIGSVLGDPNDLALVLMFPFAFALGLLLTRGVAVKLRLLGAVAVPVLFFAVIATQSRGGLLGVLTVMGVFGYRRIESKALLMGVGTVVAACLFVFAGISGRKSGGAAEEGLDASAQGRLYAWEAAVGMAVDNPFTGVGIDNFYSNYYFYSKHWDGLNHAVHSTWFGILAETGMLGFAVFVTLVTTLLRSAWRCADKIGELIKQQQMAIDINMSACAQAITASLAGTIVSGTFLTHGFTWPIYILAGLTVALAHWTDNLQNENFSLHAPQYASPSASASQ